MMTVMPTLIINYYSFKKHSEGIPYFITMTLIPILNPGISRDVMIMNLYFVQYFGFLVLNLQIIN